jgi:hypothetical protein
MGQEQRGSAKCSEVILPELGMTWNFERDWCDALSASPATPDFVNHDRYQDNERITQIDTLETGFSYPRPDEIPDDRVMSLHQHLSELRHRLFFIASSCFGAFIVTALLMSGHWWRTRLPWSLTSALFTTYIVVCIQGYRYIRPGLTRAESRTAGAAIALTGVCIFLVAALSWPIEREWSSLLPSVIVVHLGLLMGKGTVLALTFLWFGIFGWSPAGRMRSGPLITRFITVVLLLILIPATVTGAALSVCAMMLAFGYCCLYWTRRFREIDHH